MLQVKVQWRNHRPFMVTWSPRRGDSWFYAHMLDLWKADEVIKQASNARSTPSIEKQELLNCGMRMSRQRF